MNLKRGVRYLDKQLRKVKIQQELTLEKKKKTTKNNKRYWIERRIKTKARPAAAER